MAGWSPSPMQLLLLAFFVMMLTFTEFDIPAFEEAAKAITNEVGYKDELTTTEELKEVEDIVFEMEADQVVKVRKDNAVSQLNSLAEHSLNLAQQNCESASQF